MGCPVNVEQETPSRTTPPPRLWLVLGDKKGDNGQVYTIAQALGWPYELKHVQMLERFVYGKPKVRPSLYHIDRERSDSLQPPWPDLILTVGRRPANVALWVREQSGGHTKIVLLSKPSGMMKQFSLIVASAETRFPVLPNVVSVALPLMQVDSSAVAEAAKAWQERFADLARPLIAMMVGGPTNPFVYKRSVAKRLVGAANDTVARGGTPYITTSRRTPPAIVSALKHSLPPEAQLFEWTPESRNNPYLGLLGLADGFIVTGDSISMMVEVARLRKPLAILPLPTGFLGTIDQLRRSGARWLFAQGSGSFKDRMRNYLARMVYYSGFIRHTRDFRAFHRMLVDRRLAVWAGQGFAPPTGEVPDDVGLVAQRIKRLMGS